MRARKTKRARRKKGTRSQLVLTKAALEYLATDFKMTLDELEARTNPEAEERILERASSAFPLDAELLFAARLEHLLPED